MRAALSDASALLLDFTTRIYYTDGMDAFKYKSPNFKKLAAYGFSPKGGTYSYATKIYDCQFELRIDISADRKVKTELIDLSTDEPYTLHLVEGAGGAFVGAVRAEYERALTAVADACFEKDIFKGDCAHAVIDYVRETYGDEPEYLWRTFPSNAIWRRKDNAKWYGVILLLSKRKLGLNSDEVIPVIDLRGDPEALPALIDGRKYFPGYHMNKKHWFTVCLDGSVPPEEIYGLIDESYALT